MALRAALVDDRLIADRERLGIDRWDESWAGVYVMNPPPRQPHQRAARRIAAALEALGLAEVDTAVGVGDAQDYRVPDVVVYRSGQLDRESLYLGAALLVVEVVSPGESPHAKLAFFAKHADEVLLVEADRLELFTGDGHGQLHAVEPRDGWLIGRHVAARLDPSGHLVIALPDRVVLERVSWP